MDAQLKRWYCFKTEMSLNASKVMKQGHLTKEEVTEQMIELQGLLSGHNHSDLGYQG